MRDIIALLLVIVVYTGLPIIGILSVWKFTMSVIITFLSVTPIIFISVFIGNLVMVPLYRDGTGDNRDV